MSHNRFSALSDHNKIQPIITQKPKEIFPRAPTKNFRKNSRNGRNGRNNEREKNIIIPPSVLHQFELRKKYNYSYRVVNNGNVENNTTIYVTTLVAHPYQVEELFNNAIEKAKKMPEIFGEDFECDFKLNLIRRFNGDYMGYGFVDVSNPKFYFALIGCNVDGSDRAEYINDPNWLPPKIVPKAPRESKPSTESWADMCDEIEDECQLSPPKIRQELPPLISLGEYEYDQEQRSHLQTDETHGTLSVSPAYITPGVREDYDDCCLYVSEVPDINYDFLYALFARYARSDHYREQKGYYFPRINIRKCSREIEGSNKTGIFAIVEYGNSFDTAFCLSMMQKIRASFNGRDISMPVRYAYRNKH